MRAGILEAVGGAIISVVGVGERFLGIVQSLAFIKQHWPTVYQDLINPNTAVGAMVLGGLIFLDGARRFSRTAGNAGILPLTIMTTSSSGPVQNIDGSRGGQVAGRDIINQFKSPEPVKQGRPVKVKPVLVHRGIANALCDLPYWDQSRRRWENMSVQCNALAIRNDADSSQGFADNVVAHLDFDSDTFESVSVNEGWWIEDVDNTGHDFYISRSQTKHLVLVARSEAGECLTVPKVWDKESHRHLVGDSETLKAGQWRLTAEITGENVRNRFYSVGTVHTNGLSQWSSPVTSRPSEWPPEKEYI